MNALQDNAKAISLANAYSINQQDKLSLQNSSTVHPQTINFYKNEQASESMDPSDQSFTSKTIFGRRLVSMKEQSKNHLKDSYHKKLVMVEEDFSDTITPEDNKVYVYGE